MSYHAIMGDPKLCRTVRVEELEVGTVLFNGKSVDAIEVENDTYTLTIDGTQVTRPGWAPVLVRVEGYEF